VDKQAREKRLNVRWICEISSNHNGSLERAMALLEAAAEAGFTDVKTQAFHVEQLFAPEALEARPELLERKQYEVPAHWHRTLRQEANARGMRYGVTPCSLSVLEEIVPYVDWLKIGSYSLLDVKLLKAAASTGLPLVVSNGMATEKEVNDALFTLSNVYLRDWKKIGDPLPPRPLSFLHCVSSYPAPPHEANLRSIPFLKKRFGFTWGWSDHTVSNLVVGRAQFVHGAELIELHWDLEDGLGAEAAHSWTPAERLPIYHAASDQGFYACDGKAEVKAPSVSESSERDWRADPEDGLRPLKALRATLKPCLASRKSSE